MKNLLKTLVILFLWACTISFCLYIYGDLFINSTNIKTQCGNNVLKELREKGFSKTKINEYVFNFISKSGVEYTVTGHLYRIDKQFLNEISLKSTTGFISSVEEIRKAFDHYMIYFFMNDFPNYLYKEHSILLDGDTIKKMEHTIINMILTRKGLLKLNTGINTQILENIEISSNIFGENGMQYMSAISQIITSDQLEYIIRNYNNTKALESLSYKNAGLDYILRNMVFNDTKQNFLDNTLVDLVNLANKSDIITDLSKNYMINKFEFGEKTTLEKIYLPGNTMIGKSETKYVLNKLFQAKHVVAEFEETSEHISKITKKF